MKFGDLGFGEMGLNRTVGPTVHVPEAKN